jgi:hypothetical protein
MIRRSLLSAVAVLFLAAPVLAAPPPWTAAGTTAVIDEASVPLYTLTPPYIGFSATAGAGLIHAYFNVTDTSATGLPGWTMLELSAFDNHPQSHVQAVLYRVDKCNGAITAICGITSSDNAQTTCARCNVPPLDFTLYNYYVHATLYRSSTTLWPKLYGVRLY